MPDGHPLGDQITPDVLNFTLDNVQCLTLILSPESYFNYGCCSWFPFLNENLKIKLQKAHNNCISFGKICLRDLL